MTSTSTFTPLDRLLQLQLNTRETERAFNLHVHPNPEGILLIIQGDLTGFILTTAAPDLHSAAASINFHELERRLSTP